MARSRALLPLLAALLLLVPVSALPPAPSRLPQVVGMGVAQSVCESWSESAGIELEYVYVYATGAFGSNWYTWNADGAYIETFVTNALNVLAASPVPVITYEGFAPNGGVHAVRVNTTRMNMYFQDFERLLTHTQSALTAAAAADAVAVVHVEPDPWGEMNQAAADPTTLYVAVADSGYARAIELGEPNTAAGFARTVIRMRDELAPDVLLAYHWSHWGTGEDVYAQQNWPSMDAPRAAVDDAAEFLLGLTPPGGPHFDLFFSDPGDRDADWFYFNAAGDTQRWWDPDELAVPSGDARSFNRARELFGRFGNATGLRGMLWQMPLGNTYYRTCNNSDGHYRDNKVETLLPPLPASGPGSAYNRSASSAIGRWADAGLIGVLFGSGTLAYYCDAGSSTTHHSDWRNCPAASACDGESPANRDGVTNPTTERAPLGGLPMSSFSTHGTHVAVHADDDGGYLRLALQAYNATGAFPLPLGEDGDGGDGGGDGSGSGSDDAGSGDGAASAAVRAAASSYLLMVVMMVSLW